MPMMRGRLDAKGSYPSWASRARVHLETVEVWDIVSGWKRKNNYAKALLTEMIDDEYHYLISDNELAKAASIKDPTGVGEAPVAGKADRRNFTRSYVDDFHSVLSNPSLPRLRQAITAHRKALISEAAAEGYEIDPKKSETLIIGVKGPTYRLVGLNIDWELKFNDHHKKRLSLGKAPWRIASRLTKLSPERRRQLYTSIARNIATWGSWAWRDYARGAPAETKLRTLEKWQYTVAREITGAPWGTRRDLVEGLANLELGGVAKAREKEGNETGEELQGRDGKGKGKEKTFAQVAAESKPQLPETTGAKAARPATPRGEAHQSAGNQWRTKDLWQARLHGSPNWKDRWREPRAANGHMEEFKNQVNRHLGPSSPYKIRRVIVDQEFSTERILLMADTADKQGPRSLIPLQEVVGKANLKARVDWDKRMVEIVTFDIGMKEELARTGRDLRDENPGSVGPRDARRLTVRQIPLRKGNPAVSIFVTDNVIDVLKDGLKFRGGRIKCFLREDIGKERSDKARRYRYTDSEGYCIHFQVGQVIEWVPKQRNLPEWVRTFPRRKEAEEVVNLNGGWKQTCQYCRKIGDHHPQCGRANQKGTWIPRKTEEQQMRPHRAPGTEEAAC
ncbi:hypothetical protein BDZ91DRAFT_801983 [Kalaharituber pfeilii]|nr:hypothetical protein BDZ91DRAFT_801983 [Kalaharituber pfeilii]